MLKKENLTISQTKADRDLEHDEVGGPPGEHEDGLVGQGGVHNLVGHKLRVQDLDDLALKERNVAFSSKRHQLQERLEKYHLHPIKHASVDVGGADDGRLHEV